MVGTAALPLCTMLRGLGRLAGVLAFAATCSSAWAQDAYPSKPIRLVVAYPPGGSTDITARIVGPRLSELLGVPVVIENKGGANGTIGTDFVAKGTPDGYTILLTSISPLVIAPHVFKRGTPYDTLTDLSPINGVAANPSTLAVHPSLGVKDLKSFIELAKTRDIAVSTSGEGGLPHLEVEALKKAANARLVHVPYKGGGPAVADAVAGHVQAVVIDLAAVSAFIQSGRVIGLAVSSDKRSEFLPDVPTGIEQGYPAFHGLSWIGIFAPPKTPRPMIEKLHSALVAVLAQPQVKEGLAKQGLSTFSWDGPDAFQKFVRDEHAKWGRVARDANVSLD